MKRTVLVTGANRGIGLAIARRLAELGNSVLLGSRNFEAGEPSSEIKQRLFVFGFILSGPKRHVSARSSDQDSNLSAIGLCGESLY
ncbi:MAG TPA: SDR family NAD(P)-dependent oxidoreductase [Planctomycetaceae bacterium]|nr:SDR family NAD(P)-dependent oxidoreductase [Planctomycetaceae bacterium]